MKYSESANVRFALGIFLYIFGIYAFRHILKIGKIESSAILLLPIALVFPYVAKKASSASYLIRKRLSDHGKSISKDYSSVLRAAQSTPGEEIKSMLNNYRRYQLIGFFLSGYSISWIIGLLISIF